MVTANERKLDRNQAVYIVHMSANRWLSVRLEFLGGLMILGSAIFSVCGTVRLLVCVVANRWASECRL